MLQHSNNGCLCRSVGMSEECSVENECFISMWPTQLHEQCADLLHACCMLEFTAWSSQLDSWSRSFACMYLRQTQRVYTICLIITLDNTAQLTLLELTTHRTANWSVNCYYSLLDCSTFQWHAIHWLRTLDSLFHTS